jgi:hypothetical protein
MELISAAVVRISASNEIAAAPRSVDDRKGYVYAYHSRLEIRHSKCDAIEPVERFRRRLNSANGVSR